ncbi:MAG: hypothetical protein ACHQ9S_16545 [Candidatus Binatia bacterium]
MIVIEATPGTNGVPVSKVPYVQPGCGPGVGRPDLQIETTRNMGTASTPLCSLDGSITQLGYIPGIPTPSFGPDTGPTPTITNALQNFSLTFTYHDPLTGPCTKDAGGNDAYFHAGATQFCSDQITGAQSFPQGESLLTLQVLDANHNPGPTAQIIVRVPTWTPTPTITPTQPTSTATATQPSATPTVTFTPTMTGTPTGTPTATLASTLTATSTAASTLTPSVTPTQTPTSTPTATSSPTLTATGVATPTPTVTPTPSATPTATETPTPFPTETFTPGPTPTNTP